MEKALWELVLSGLFLPLYPNNSRSIVRCPITNKILFGSLIIKTDAGPGRLCTEAKSWTFREHLWQARVYIMLGLPNGTAVNQEMDQVFSSYQPTVKVSMQRVVNIKLAQHVLGTKKGPSHRRRTKQ